MDSPPPALAFLRLLCSGWVNRQQQAVIDYLLEENVSSASRTGRTGCVSPTISGAAWP